MYGLVESFSSTITSYALDTNSKWPYVTMPHMEARGSDFLSVSNAHLVGFAPIVNLDNINEWNSYSILNQGWIQDSYNYINENDYEVVVLEEEVVVVIGNTTSNATAVTASANSSSAEAPAASSSSSVGVAPDPIRHQVHRTDPKEGNVIAVNKDTIDSYVDIVVPLWQEAHAPLDTQMINNDLYSHPIFRKVFDFSRDTNSAILSQVFPVEELLGEEARVVYSKKELYGTDDYAGTEEIHPESILVQNVYDTFNKNTRQVVGALVTVIPWDIYLNDVLHEGANGVVCVLKDTCGDAFTYKLYGREAVFLGEGDLHESKYDYLEYVTPFAPFIDFTAADDDLVAAHCEYSLHIYPSTEMEDEYHNNKPIYYSIGAVSVFLITSFVFLLYDVMVRIYD